MNADPLAGCLPEGIRAGADTRGIVPRASSGMWPAPCRPPAGSRAGPGWTLASSLSGIRPEAAGSMCRLEPCRGDGRREGPRRVARRT